MGVLRKAESGLEKAFLGIFRRRTDLDVTPVEVAGKLVKEMEDGKLETATAVFVPSEYTVYLCPRDWARYEARAEAVSRQLEAYLLERARRERYRMLSAPSVRLTCDQDLRPGQFGIARGPAGSVEEGHAPSPSASSVEAWATRPTPVLTLTHGRRTQEFRSSRVLLGRAEEADFRIDDPNVSRRHAVLLWDRGRLYVRDLGSTNGTFLNGRPVNSAVLRSGDVLRLGPSEVRVELS